MHSMWIRINPDFSDNSGNWEKYRRPNRPVSWTYSGNGRTWRASYPSNRTNKNGRGWKKLWKTSEKNRQNCCSSKSRLNSCRNNTGKPSNCSVKKNKRHKLSATNRCSGNRDRPSKLIVRNSRLKSCADSKGKPSNCGFNSNRASRYDNSKRRTNNSRCWRLASNRTEQLGRPGANGTDALAAIRTKRGAECSSRYPAINSESR